MNRWLTGCVLAAGLILPAFVQAQPDPPPPRPIAPAPAANQPAANPPAGNAPAGNAPAGDAPAAAPRTVELSVRTYVFEWIAVGVGTVVAVFAVGRTSRRA